MHSYEHQKGLGQLNVHVHIIPRKKNLLIIIGESTTDTSILYSDADASWVIVSHNDEYNKLLGEPNQIVHWAIKIQLMNLLHDWCDSRPKDWR